MPDKKYTLKPGKRASIEINGRSHAQPLRRPEAFSSKGIIPVRRKKNHLARRLQAGGIEFYDLGQYVGADGLIYDENISIPATIETDNSGGYISVWSPGAAQAKVLSDLILMDGADFGISKAPKVTTEWMLEYFDFTFLNFFKYYSRRTAEIKEIFKNDKVNLPQEFLDAPNLRFRPGGAHFYELIFHDEAAAKSTVAYDFDAEEANYSPRIGDKFYMVPKLIHGSSAGSQDINLGGLYSWHLNSDDYRICPRQTDLNPASEFYQEFWDALSSCGWDKNDDTAANYARAMRRLKWMRANFPARTHRRSEFIPFSGGKQTQYIWTNQPEPDFLPPSTFPASHPPPAIAGQFRIGISDFDVYPGTLLAIVKRKSQFFYLWQPGEAEGGSGGWTDME